MSRILLFLLFLIWLAVNAADGYWMYNYWKRPFTAERLSGVDKPLNRQFSGMAAFGFFWGWVNVAVCWSILHLSQTFWSKKRAEIKSKPTTTATLPQRNWFSRRNNAKYNPLDSEIGSISEKSFDDIAKAESGSISDSIPERKSKSVISPVFASTLFTLSWWILTIFVLLPLCIALCLAPFIFPFIARTIKWNTAVDHRCDSYLAEARMTPQMNMATSLYFTQNGVRTKYAEYRFMTSSKTLNLTYHTPMPATSVTTPPANLQPTVYQVQYSLATHTMFATCFQAGSTNGTTASRCMEGSYDPNNFSFTINDTRTNTTSHMQSTEAAWYSGSSEPSFTLKDVQSDGQLGAIALETASAFTKCASIRLCLSRGSGPDMLAPLGLALSRHSQGDMTSCNSNSGGGGD